MTNATADLSASTLTSKVWNLAQVLNRMPGRTAPFYANSSLTPLSPVAQCRRTRRTNPPALLARPCAALTTPREAAPAITQLR